MLSLLKFRNLYKFVIKTFNKNLKIFKNMFKNISFTFHTMFYNVLKNHVNLNGKIIQLKINIRRNIICTYDIILFIMS